MPLIPHSSFLICTYMESSNPQPPTPNPDDLISIGEVVTAHGVRGQLRVTMLTDFPERWRKLRQVYLTPQIVPRGPRPAPAPRPYAVTGTRVLGGARSPRRMR